MKITFSWIIEENSTSPNCTSDTLNGDNISILSCLLMDDGGIPYLQSVPCIQEGINKVDSVLNGEVASENWDREAWGALLTIDGAKIYSLYDEDYFENVTLKQLKNALVAWKNFLETKPEHDKRKEIKL